jgi:chemotaxis protein methyltransferase CheR
LHDSSKNEEIALDLLLEAIYLVYGYDFRDYAKDSIMRRTKTFMLQKQEEKIANLIPLVIHDESYFRLLLPYYSINVTSFFRNIDFYKSLVKEVFPKLSTYPFFKIWHAGCSTGEEVYSLAILLKEHGLYDKATIFATDFNDKCLKVAQKGVYKLEDFHEAKERYGKICKEAEFIDKCFTEKNNLIKIGAALQKNITFANHNLVTDGVFGEMQLILCRNVLIYFNRDLMNATLLKFNESLRNGGILCLGTKESIRDTSIEEIFTTIDPQQRIFKKLYKKIISSSENEI